jgi:hypothetical protein
MFLLKLVVLVGHRVTRWGSRGVNPEERRGGPLDRKGLKGRHQQRHLSNGLASQEGIKLLNVPLSL